MNGSDGHQREERVFDEALALSAEERPAFLADACGDDADLRRRVEELLREHDATENALDRSPGRELIAEMASATQPEGAALASRAGRYRLGEKVGEGGCGAVYAAEQLHPVRRSVAIKIIKPGMDTRAVVARFQAEQQALALMEHPNIARVFDAGGTATGRPFFVMELVRGVRITEFCDRQRLPLPARIRLFAQVCQAIQHAHQKGIIHRDLKPSNILVDGRADPPRPKVIDFGIARAAQGRLTDATFATEVGAFVGTPAYVSPEQAAHPGGDIDTRTDIYSLGVVLHELLAGTTSLDGTQLGSLGVDEIRQRIRHEDTPRPSQRLRALEPARLAAVARDRQVEPRALVVTLARDLDWIVLRCLEKDRARRYESVGALAADLEHYLNHEPVVARPPSQVYLLKKLVRRHRLAFAAGGAVALALLAGIAVSTSLLLRERAARVRAVAAEAAQERARRHAEAEQRRTQTEMVRSAEISRLLLEVLSGMEPVGAPGRRVVSLTDILDATAQRIASDLRSHPEVQADLRRMLGWTYHRLGETGRAEAVQRLALAQQREIHGVDHPKVAEILTELAVTLTAVETGEALEEREKLLGEAVAILRGVRGGQSLALARALAALADVLAAADRFGPAETAQRESVEMTKRLAGDEPATAARRLFGLGRILSRGGQVASAASPLQEALELFRQHPGARDPDGVRLRTLELLAQLHLESGRPVQAEALAREALAGRRLQESDRPNSVQELLAQALREQGRFDEARAVAREPLASERSLTQKN